MCCIVSTENAANFLVFYGGLSVHGCRLRYEGICQIQNRYDFLKGENQSFHVDINLSASLKDLTVFYGGLSVHGGCLRYEGICQIQNRYDFLKGENLSFHVDIN